MSEWQPIETAPNEDGKEILLLVDGEPQAGHWYVIPFVEYRDGEGFYVGQQDNDEGWCSFRNGPGVNPTHWMPLPPPPKEPTLSKSLIHSVNHVVEPREGESSMQGIRCPNANDEQCRYPDCKCHEV